MNMKLIAAVVSVVLLGSASAQGGGGSDEETTRSFRFPDRNNLGVASLLGQQVPAS